MSELEALEDRLGCRIPSSVRTLYGLLGSATFRWRFSPALDEQTKGRIAEEFATAVSRGNLYSAAAAIELLPLEEVLFGEENEVEYLDGAEGGDGLVFYGNSYSEEEFTAMLRPVDWVNDFFAMAFVVRPEDSEWKMILLQDYGADYESSRTVLLEDYLRFVISTLGLVNARAELFGEYRGYRSEVLRYAPDIAAARVPPMLRSLTNLS
ncbi:hypothetical protein [Streptomyces sp. NPDC085466]|uniref:hypothetical protein n=1 Tax=Streptomyces sp. NPDC085466 TaxID=3365725 RepID=UPI0037D3E377